MRATSASLRRAIKPPPASNISFDRATVVCARRIDVLLLLRITQNQ
jgi:hypothetical protein